MQKLENLDQLEILLGPLDQEYTHELARINASIWEKSKADLQETLRLKLSPYDRNHMNGLYPDLQTESQAQRAHQVLGKVQNAYWQSPDMTIERAVADTMSALSREEIGTLPDKMRIQLLNTMNTATRGGSAATDHDYMNRQRIRLALGEEIKPIQSNAPIKFDAARSISMSPAMGNLLISKEEELRRREDEFFKTHPEHSDIRERWQKSPSLVTQQEKDEVTERLHALHAETFDYIPAPIIKTSLNGISAMASDVKFGDTTGLILLNPAKIDTLTYKETRDMIMHESDHIAQSKWMREYSSLPVEDPRRDYTERAAAFAPIHADGPAMSPYGMTSEATVLHYAQPNEAHAYLLHDPHRPENAVKPQDIINNKQCLPALCR